MWKSTPHSIYLIDCRQVTTPLENTLLHIIEHISFNLIHQITHQNHQTEKVIRETFMRFLYEIEGKLAPRWTFRGFSFLLCI